MTRDLRTRLVAIYGALLGLNVAAWIWAFAAFHARLVPLALSLMVYGLGLRHAVDADHIAAIDNVTRKLMQQNQRPVAVGFWFALGHSTVVAMLTAAVIAAASLFGGLQRLQQIGETVGTLISMSFLFAIAAVNLAVFAAVYRSWRRTRAGCTHGAEDPEAALGARGLLATVFRRAFRLVGRSWHMFLIGVLFGLGFDTATEVAVFGLSAAQAAEGVSAAAILVLPVLFAAGMSLIDTTDGILMLGAYGWAFMQPARKLVYNMAITLSSVAVALVVGGIEAAGLIGGRFGIEGRPWRAVAAINDDFSSLGFAIVGVFLLAWALSYALYRARKFGTAARTAR